MEIGVKPILEVVKYKSIAIFMIAAYALFTSDTAIFVKNVVVVETPIRRAKFPNYQVAKSSEEPERQLEGTNFCRAAKLLTTHLKRTPVLVPSI